MRRTSSCGRIRSRSSLTNPRRRRLALALVLGVLAVAAALIHVTVTGPRVYLRWRDTVDIQARLARERQYDLRSGEPDRQSPDTWQYELGDRSRDNLAAIVADPDVLDTHNIDRDALTAPRPSVGVTLRSLPQRPFPFNGAPGFPGPASLFQIQSLWLLLSGGLLLVVSRWPDARRRRGATVVTLLVVGILALTFPISPTFVTMSDARQHVGTRLDFDGYAAVERVRIESHLTTTILGQIDRLYGRTDESPRRAQTIVARAATVAFMLLALTVGVLDGWSVRAVRYLALALLAPSALMYFGWREFGYLSLNVAAFPLLMRGLRDDSPHLEAAGLLAGVGGALHGWGLVSLVGACLAALTAPAHPAMRLRRTLRIGIWGTAGYTAWLPIYLIILKMPIVTGHAESIPWRSWLTPTVFDRRMGPAALSAAGLRDLLMTAWVVGATLLAPAASLWRESRDDVRTALAYALPSLLFSFLVWHTQGIHEDMDVVFGIFPGVFALAWICASNDRRTRVAAVLLASAHLAFWRIVLDPSFRSVQIPDS